MTSIVQTVGELELELEADARRTWTRWDEIRRGPMRAYVLAELAASRHSATREYAALAALLGPAWYPVQTDHPFPAWRRDVVGEAPEVLIELALSAVVAACDTDHDLSALPRSGVLLVYPTLLADFLVAFDREHTGDRLAGGASGRRRVRRPQRHRPAREAHGLRRRARPRPASRRGDRHRRRLDLRMGRQDGLLDPEVPREPEGHVTPGGACRRRSHSRDSGRRTNP